MDPGVEEKIIFGLVGFRCAGKSFLRQVLRELDIQVFDTNSVRTGDADAKVIPMTEILDRYGENRSYLLYLFGEMKKFSISKQCLFVDSFKVRDDPQVCRELFPDYKVRVIYLHAAYKLREKRYEVRDVATGMREEALREHDQSLEDAGIWDVIKEADNCLDMSMTKDQLIGDLHDIFSSNSLSFSVVRNE